jgi:site-specific recombinase XerD
MTASVMIRAGVDPVTVKTWLDHAQLSTTEIYVHPDDPALVRAARKLEQGLSKGRGNGGRRGS